MAQKQKQSRYAQKGLPPRYSQLFYDWQKESSQGGNHSLAIRLGAAHTRACLGEALSFAAAQRIHWANTHRSV